MVARKPAKTFDAARKAIAYEVRLLRRGRHWTQADLAKRLGLSQSRLNEIESGDGSFTAEQFLEILRLFNVDVAHFAGVSPRDAEIQNALSRLGALHLLEDPEVLPSSRLREVNQIMREVLIEGRNPRHIAALAPVVVHNINGINLHHLQRQLSDVGLDRRLPWLIENILEAIAHERARKSAPAAWQRQARRAELVLSLFLDACRAVLNADAGSPKDLLDADIRSLRTLRDVDSAGSEISKRWAVVSSLQTRDFAEAIHDAIERH